MTMRFLKSIIAAFLHKKFLVCKNRDFQFDLTVNLRITINSCGKMDFVTIPAKIDTGFSGGVRLPADLWGNVQHLYPTGSQVGPFTHEGFPGSKVFDQYILLFEIEDDRKTPHRVASHNVFFSGRKYALIGLDFLRECKCELTVQGSPQNFSFFVEEAESFL